MNKLTISWIIVIDVLLLVTITESSINHRHQNQFSKDFNDTSTHYNVNGLPVKAWSRKRRVERTHPKRSIHKRDKRVNNEAIDSFGTFLNSTSTPHAYSDPNLLDILVIGAGWSGISAAVTLHSQGISNFKVLEAKEYIGGRSHTITESWNGRVVTMDMGSAWIHGTKNSPVFDIVKEKEFPYSIDRGFQRFFQENNKGPFEGNIIWPLYRELLEGFLSYVEKKQRTTNRDKNLRSVFNQYVKSKRLGVFKKSVLEMFLSTSIVQEYAASLEDLSLWWWDNTGDNFWDSDIYLTEGYSSVLLAYAEPVMEKIKTQAVVTKIDYKKSRVKVTYKDADGTKLVAEARKVLVTVPLSVLRDNSIQFRPRLPAVTRKVMTQVGMGLENKIHMFWNVDDIFWSTGTQWFTDFNTKNGRFEFFNPHSYNGGLPYLCGFIAGDEAKYLEDQFGDDDDKYKLEMVKRAMVPLRNMFGQSIPNPEKVRVTKWGKDPFVKGSYSYNKVKMAKWSRWKMNRPVKDRVYFAGEAMSQSYFGTTHGAYLSGKQAINQIMKSMKDAALL